MKGKLVLRILAILIDGMLIYLPSHMLLTILGFEGFLLKILPQFLFVVYNTVSLSSFEGKTIGKYFSRLTVYTEEPGMIHVGLREASKLLYFLPNIGILFLFLSGLSLLIFKLTLHDLISQSQVLLDVEREIMEREEHIEKQLY
ncbi:RDD family protein [Carnobacterium iners]|uniref:RDD family protein n=1 Tax=Carnobacterium iners TaxID=1073423 RepID=A0A1X7MUF1_9LACT|nr:RDD family protein [Carnobacterium iners]SEK55891.1 RDD family protein [Carnobacterium iners]SMH28284.1 RDD family protein [Carnobacterium iners]